MILNGKEGLKYQVHIDRICLEYVLEFIYLGCFGRIRYRWSRVYNRKVVSDRRVANAIKSLINARNL